jgi:hypothetical protein
LPGEIRIALKNPEPNDFDVEFKAKQFKVNNEIKAEIRVLDGLGTPVSVCLFFLFVFLFKIAFHLNSKSIK